ncbi:MAG TPA: 16S rRNA (cytidine(1402)-2'-O)-methyltransferase [Gemmatimonadaceae bacterium]|nr:16S rRNA (cytidine(1402)-2'-O)-methyltransferase [Gemmatimonadaceae bacterium]
MSTPIGNLRDMTLRAIDVLKAVDFVLAEDTRHSRHLLDHHGIDTRMVSYHEHNEARATESALGRLREGRDVALISDAGTPLLSDPGARLVNAAAEAGIPVVPVPGPSALLAALVASAIGAERFTYFGFLARKGRERDDAIRDLSGLTHTGVLYEAPNRVAATLAELERSGAGSRRACVARELTKQFEELRRGTVTELAAYYDGSPPRGEVVIVLEGLTPEPLAEDELRSRARALRETGLSARDVAAALVRDAGASRNLAYRLAHEA